ncbi:hypothetical protein HPG69_005824 [Diceros bicornis minor]|uniref:Uncharacterized protein n=1 Tax=Diceros bicornis minor TaxID=77932 RepID=A0A7J7ETI9_DICBM|nr:hypothetical protein HPG69_005824 [Diceros bicornis minor]
MHEQGGPINHCFNLQDQEENMANAMVIWTSEILPNWEVMHSRRKVGDLRRRDCPLVFTYSSPEERNGGKASVKQVLSVHISLYDTEDVSVDDPVASLELHWTYPMHFYLSTTFSRTAHIVMLYTVS